MQVRQAVEVGCWKLEDAKEPLIVDLSLKSHELLLELIRLASIHGQKSQTVGLTDLQTTDINPGGYTLFTHKYHDVRDTNKKGENVTINGIEIRIGQAFRIRERIHHMTTILYDEGFIFDRPGQLIGGRKLTGPPTINFGGGISLGPPSLPAELEGSLPTYPSVSGFADAVEDLCPVTETAVQTKLAQLANTFLE